MRNVVLLFAAGIGSYGSGLAASEQGRFAVKSLRAERLRLTSGVCRMRGHRVLHFRDHPESEFETMVLGTLCFDDDKYYIDVRGPAWVIDPGSVVSGDGSSGRVTSNSVRGVCQKAYVTDGAEASFWISFQPMAELAPANVLKIPKIVRSEILDLRCPTVFGPVELSQNQSLNKVLDKIESLSWAVEEEANGVWRLSHRVKEDGESELVFTLAVDTRRGFAPQLMKAHSVYDGKAYKEWETSTEWSEINGAWVPVHLRRQVFEGPSSKIDDHLDLDFDWSSVNERVDSSKFTFASIEMPAATGVQDTSSGEWIKPYPVQPVPPGSNGQGTWLLSAIVLLNVAVLVLWFIVRRVVRNNRERVGSVRDRSNGRSLSAKRRAVIAAMLLIGALAGLGYRFGWLDLGRLWRPDVVVSSWTPVKFGESPGPVIDLGRAPIGGRVHREVFIENNTSSPLVIRECVSDYAGVRLLLPSPRIFPRERVGAYLDCDFTEGVEPGMRTINVKAIKEDGASAFTLNASVVLYDGP